MEEPLIISNTPIPRGKTTRLDLAIAKLPSHTQIEIPVIISRAKREGPTMLLLSGVHGDEINGIEIVRRLIDQKLTKPSAGTVICIPVLNVFGFINYTREVPGGKDVNRSFPGQKRGSLASRVAYNLMKEIIPHVDYVLDFHTGAESRSNFPQVRGMLKDERVVELAKVFGAPFIINSPIRSSSLRKEVVKKNVPMLLFEGGESMRFDERAIQAGMNGAVRVMNHLGMTHAQADEMTSEPVTFNESKWIRARSSGLFHSKVKNGAEVTNRQEIGFITDPYATFRTRVRATASGHVIGLNHKPVVSQGDALFHIAY
jgi:predicted deacylase